jgi:hypothetical protein
MPNLPCAAIIEADDVAFYGVLAENVDDVWGEIEGYLIKTLEYSDDKYTIKDIRKSLKNKSMQLWLAYSKGELLSYAITQIQSYPTMKIFFILYVGGIEMYKWLWCMNVMIDYARESGCQTIDCLGREGWARAIREFGFKKIASVFRLSI